MNMKSIVAMLALLILGIYSQTAPALEEFNSFIETYKKRYQTREEFNFRLDIFSRRYYEFQEFNRKEESFKKAVNFFSDLTPKERFSFLGSSDRFFDKVPQDDETKLLAEDFGSVALPQYFTDEDRFTEVNEITEALPFFGNVSINLNFLMWWLSLRKVCKTRDWEANGKMTPVKNQANCGSCWAFAAVGLVEAQYRITYNSSRDLAEQELLDCDGSNSACLGGNMYRALNYIKDNRIAYESSYPYIASKNVCKTNTSLKTTIKAVNRTSVRNSKSFLRQLCKSPETVYFYVADDFFDYSTGIYNGAGCKGQTGVNHGVIAVGHNINSATPYVKFKNSWGSWWGENGYFKMKLKTKIVTDGTCNMLKYGSEFITV